MRRDREWEAVIGSVPLRVRVTAVLELCSLGFAAAAFARRGGDPVSASVGWGLVTLAVVAVSVAAHELGHLSVARRHRLEIVAVHITGALRACVRRQSTTLRRTEMSVALAGPAATVLVALAAATAVLLGHGAVAHAGLIGVALNATVLLVSMAPIPGADGTRAWRARRLAAGSSTWPRTTRAGSGR